MFPSTSKLIAWTGKMAQQVKELTVNLDDLSMTLGTHTV